MAFGRNPAFLCSAAAAWAAQSLHEVAFDLFVSTVLTRGDAWTTQDILPSLEPGGFIETVPARMPAAAVG